MNDREQPKRRELMPDTDPELLRAALNPVEEPEPDYEFDPDDPGSAWLLGDDPEADVQRTADRRNAIKSHLPYRILDVPVTLETLARFRTILLPTPHITRRRCRKYADRPRRKATQKVCQRDRGSL